MTFPRGSHLVEYNEFGGVRNSVPVEEYERIKAQPNGWTLEEDETGVHATGPEGTYHRYELYPRREVDRGDAERDGRGLCRECGYSPETHSDDCKWRR